MTLRTALPIGVVALVALVACALVWGSCRKEMDAQPQATSTKRPPVTVISTSGTCDDTERCAVACNDRLDGDACRRLAVTFEFGKSDAGRNEKLATTLYDRSCALGDATGCLTSGQMHELGHGVTPDLAFATGAYSRACTLGSQPGCANWNRLKALSPTGAAQ